MFQMPRDHGRNVETMDTSGLNRTEHRYTKFELRFYQVFRSFYWVLKKEKEIERGGISQHLWQCPSSRLLSPFSRSLSEILLL